MFFDHLIERSEHLRTAGVTFKGVVEEGVAVGAGVAEVTQIIVALGSAGAFAALAQVAVEYIRSGRKLVLRRTRTDSRSHGDSDEELILEGNMDTESIVNSLRLLEPGKPLVDPKRIENDDK